MEILEYCESKDVIKREQYYLDKFKPEYNILKIAGSRLGSQHTEATKDKMKGIRGAYNISPERRAQLIPAGFPTGNPKGFPLGNRKH